ncbi:hypothetical protein LCGC14_2754200 [marine sediment metagenome]|uniref:Uncharacterized protein n=1 Tax=marine sediment metagenome TaxID=412755 RepID=A0A0F8Z125_9ZZZZ
MRIGILDVNIKTGKPGQCWVCKESIEVRELHTVVVLRYGKFQKSAFKLAAAQGRARTKKAGLKYRRLHLKDCLATWLIAIHHYRTEARRERKGRPAGSGQLPQMTDEDKLVRYRLVRRRAATLRLILQENNDQRLITLVGRLKSLSAQMEVDVIEDMARRSPSSVRLLNEKIRRVEDAINR